MRLTVVLAVLAVVLAIFAIALTGCANDRSEQTAAAPPSTATEASRPAAPPPSAPTSLPQPGVLDIAPTSAAGRISIAELEAQLSGGNVVLVDVRPQQAFAIEHAEGAVNIPLDQIATRGRELPGTAQIVTYCT
ncbi:MAG TPA: rhodanese-like domain-containing protein [Thermoanaerobaculia bacterium]|nr:rhodanese-like domain-containing protein [Thermoanaerobaculia bacterium]